MTDDKRRAWGQAYRDGSLICDRVHVRLDRYRPAGAAPPQRRTVIARFEGCLHPTLRAELTELALCHGTAARRAVERIKPVVLLLGDPHHERSTSSANSSLRRRTTTTYATSSTASAS